MRLHSRLLLCFRLPHSSEHATDSPCSSRDAEEVAPASYTSSTRPGYQGIWAHSSLRKHVTRIAPRGDRDGQDYQQASLAGQDSQSTLRLFLGELGRVKTTHQNQYADLDRVCKVSTGRGKERSWRDRTGAVVAAGRGDAQQTQEDARQVSKRRESKQLRVHCEIRERQIGKRASSPSDLGTHHLSSYVELQLPFSKDPQLADRYIATSGSIRLGKIFEDLDNLAGDSKYFGYQAICVMVAEAGSHHLQSHTPMFSVDVPRQATGRSPSSSLRRAWTDWTWWWIAWKQTATTGSADCPSSWVPRPWRYWLPLIRLCLAKDLMGRFKRRPASPVDSPWSHAML